VFEAAPVGMVVTEPGGRFVRANRAFCELVGYSDEDVLGLRAVDLTPPEDLDAEL
jgi:PAS domain S-box-containing protein